MDNSSTTETNLAGRMQQQVYFVGTEAEIGHHAAPLKSHLSYQVVEPGSIVSIAQPGDLAIFYSEHFDRFRESIQALKKNKVATLYMIDGILEWRNAWENRDDEPACPFTMRPVLCHKVACIGDSQSRILSTWGNIEKVEVVGVPRFDNLADRLRQSSVRGTVPEEREKAKFRLMVTTAKFPAYTEEQVAKTADALADVKTFVANRKDIDVVWRLTDGWSERIGVPNTVTDLTGREMVSELQAVDAVISTPSTAALESMLLDLPTAILDYTNSPQYVGSVWSITALDHLESVITEILNPPLPKLIYQRQILSDALQLQANASMRMKQLIDAMLSVANSAVQQGDELEFPANMLGSLSLGDNPSSQLDHHAVFEKFSEFQIDDRLELQAQLAHARREINHLQKQLDQIQSELKHAHAIFEEINGHPIAGPIVKIRRKLVALIEKIKKPNPKPM